MTLKDDTVVIAEDNLSLSMALKDYLETVHNLSVYTTVYDKGVMPLLQKTRASVLILDLMLEGEVDAEYLIPEAASIDGLLVIVLTGTWHERKEDEILRAGASVVMRKPQFPSTIWAQIEILTDSSTKVHPRQIDELGKILIRIGDNGSVYDVENGILIGAGGEILSIPERERNTMTSLSKRFIASAGKSSTDLADRGWALKDDLIKEVFEVENITSDLNRSLWYHLNELREILSGLVSDNEEDLQLIENVRIGRYKSYYRLNPGIFHIREDE